MSDAIGLIGFYFTLIGFISGLFFTRIDGWYGSVRAFSGKLASVTGRENFIIMGAEWDGLSASKPTGSFIAVGILVTTLTVLAYLFPIPNPSASPALFLYGPIVLTVIFYWLGGIILLVKARSVLSSARQKIDAGISG
jgi:predicted small integral membrane protein